jgi:two-component system, chemotaxis family, protein-glutamate methylesterase/glutaminase
MIKLLVVDDSALMRKLMQTVFLTAGDFDVQVCRNGREALAQLHVFQPDVVTLDVNMPGMDGLECLGQIMLERPCPVVMVSSLTREGERITLEALSLGAVDYVPKPAGAISLNFSQMEENLVRVVRMASGARIRRSRGLVQRLRQLNARLPETPARRRSVRSGGGQQRNASAVPGLVIIGLSTGGPRALEEILPELPADFPWPVVVAQHMPARFTAALAHRLDGLCQLAVLEADQPVALKAGQVLIARGGADALISRRAQGLYMCPCPAGAQYLWHPSVDALVQSAMHFYTPQQLIGVLMTGMGYDGAAQMAALQQQGGRTVAESQDSAVVFGMPGELVARQGATRVLPAARVAAQLCNWVGATAGPGAAHEEPGGSLGTD